LNVRWGPLLGSAGFVAISLAIVAFAEESRAIGWMGLLFFGGCLLVVACAGIAVAGVFITLSESPVIGLACTVFMGGVGVFAWDEGALAQLNRAFEPADIVMPAEQLVARRSGPRPSWRE